MKCLYCGNIHDKVVDSRASGDNRTIRRRRECLKCKRRFTTYEKIEGIQFMVTKKDGRREPFDRKKLITGMIKACEKRPISIRNLEELADSVEMNLHKRFESEVNSQIIGELVMNNLHKLDEVAYVRFASVYREFKDVNQFMDELKEILDKRSLPLKKRKRALKKSKNI